MRTTIEGVMIRASFRTRPFLFLSAQTLKRTSKARCFEPSECVRTVVTKTTGSVEIVNEGIFAKDVKDFEFVPLDSVLKEGLERKGIQKPTQIQVKAKRRPK